MAKPNWFRTTRRQRDEMRDTGSALTIGYMLVVSILIGYGLGSLVDRYFNTEPWGMLAGLVLGIAAGFYNLFEVAIRMSRQDEEKRRAKRDSGGDSP